MRETGWCWSWKEMFIARKGVVSIDRIDHATSSNDDQIEEILREVDAIPGLGAKSKRFKAYSRISREVFKFYKRTPLPLSVVEAVKRKWPEPSSQYTGFRSKYSE
jgi:hypothetical protein